MDLKKMLHHALFFFGQLALAVDLGGLERRFGFTQGLGGVAALFFNHMPRGTVRHLLHVSDAALSAMLIFGHFTFSHQLLPFRAS